MNFKLIGDNCIFTPIDTVLKNRGITKDLFNVGKEVIEPYDNLDNIQEGIDLLLKHIDNNSKIALVVDVDADGYTSSAVLYNYIMSEFKGVNLIYKMHQAKEHGLSKDIVIEDDINLVILPDASSNDFKQHNKLKERGIDVLVLDHHDCDEGYSPSAVVVNNQLSKNYNNKSLSGVGIVYKFLKALDGYIFSNKADYYLDLVALGNVADVMNLHSEETRYFVYEGIKNINNLFIKALIEDNKYDLDGKYNIEKIGWTIAPKINGTIRSGSMEEKENMFKAFISDDYNFCLEIAKACKNIKAKQDRIVKSSMEKIMKTLKFKKIDKCIILDTGETLISNHRGLVAGKLADKFGVPVLLYSNTKGKEGYIGGSFRGSNLTDHLRIDLLNSNITTMAQGHDNVGGFELKLEDVSKLEEYINEIYKDKEINLSKCYEVDFILDSNEVEEWLVDELASYEDEFGNGIDCPLMLIKNIKLNSSELNISRTNIVFNHNYIKFIKKFATNVLKTELSSIEELTLNIIGKCTMDTYNDKGQIEIVDLEIIN